MTVGRLIWKKLVCESELHRNISTGLNVWIYDSFEQENLVFNSEVESWLGAQRMGVGVRA